MRADILKWRPFSFEAFRVSGVAVRILAGFVLFFVLQNGSTSAQTVKAIFAQVRGTVSDASGRAVVDAIVRIDGPSRYRTVSDKDGSFVFADVVPGTYVLAVSATGFTSLTQPNVAVGDEDLSLHIELSKKTGLRTVGHVYSSLGRNVISTSATPSFPITMADFNDQGQTQWRKVLEEAPGISVSSNTGAVQQGIAGGIFNDQVVSIRGALPYETGMLIDNMPMYTTGLAIGAGAGIDLAEYDPSSFSSVDVVRGPGAASPSIVGTIGGSLNLHPAGQVEQNSYNLSLANDAYGGVNGNGTAQIRMNKLSASVSYNFNNSPGPNSGMYLMGQSFGSRIDSIDGLPFTCTGACRSVAVFAPGTSYRPAQYQVGLIGCCTPYPSSWVAHSGSLSLNYQASPAVTVQAFFSDSLHTGFEAKYVISTIFAPTASYAGQLPPATYNIFQNDYYGTPLTELSKVFEGRVSIQVGHGQLQLAALSNTAGYFDNFNSPSGEMTMALYGGGVFYGPGGSKIPATFNGGAHTVALMPFHFVRTEISRNRDYLASYTAELGPSARIVGSYVHSYYDDPLTCEESIGSHTPTGGVALTNFDFQNPPMFETSDQVRVGAGVNIGNVAVDLSQYFSSVRYHVIGLIGLMTDETERYAGPRFSAVWRPSRNLAVRGSAGGGFAPKDLSSMNAAGSAIPSCFSGICQLFVPNPNLQSEKSFGFDFGADYRLTANTILSADLYRTNLWGQFYTDEEPSGTYQSQPLYTYEPRNIGQSRYEGVEIDARNASPAGTYWSLSGSIMRGYVVAVSPILYDGAGCTRCSNSTIVTGINFNGTMGFATTIPYAQAFGQLGYRWTPDRYVGADIHYFGKNNGYYAPPFVVYDVEGSFPISRNASIHGTIRNLSNAYGASNLNSDMGSVYPTAFGSPSYTLTTPYGPRAFIVSLHIHS